MSLPFDQYLMFRSVLLLMKLVAEISELSRAAAGKLASAAPLPSFGDAQFDFSVVAISKVLVKPDSF